MLKKIKVLNIQTNHMQLTQEDFYNSGSVHKCHDIELSQIQRNSFTTGIFRELNTDLAYK